MKSLIALMLLLLTISAQAATFTLSWCPVQKALWYDVCVETVTPISEQCSGTYIKSAYLAGQPSPYMDLTLADNVTVWIRVRAETFTIDWVNRKTVPVYGAYSVPVQAIGGLTPPIVTCGC